jgi:hypothetical protein
MTWPSAVFPVQDFSGGCGWAKAALKNPAGWKSVPPKSNIVDRVMIRIVREYFISSSGGAVKTGYPKIMSQRCDACLSSGTSFSRLNRGDSLL